MPFTPSVLDSSYDEYVKNSKNINTSYMTITLDSTPNGKEHLEAALHAFDFTVRPQTVTRETC